MAKHKNEKTKAVVKLPQQKTELVDEFHRFVTLIFGEKKIGKSSLCSHFEDALFLPTEEGTKSLSVYQPQQDDGTPMLLDSWDSFATWVTAFVKSKRFPTAVVDTVDGAYDLCYDHCCNELGIESPSELGWGQGWDVIYREFKRVFRKLFTCRKGVVLLSHCKSKELERWDSDDTIDQLQCTITGKCGKYVTGAADIWAYYGYAGNSRRLYLRGSQRLDAGTRLTEHFLQPDGTPLEFVPMGKSSEEGYRNLMAAFDNKLWLKKRKGGKGRKRK